MTSRTGVSSTSSPPSSAGKSSKSTSPSAVQTAATTATAFSSKYTPSVPSTARTNFTTEDGSIDDEVQRMDFVSFLDDFHIASPSNTPSHNDLLNDAIPRHVQSTSFQKSHKLTSRSPKSNDAASTTSSFLRLRSQRKSDPRSKPLTSQMSDFSFGTAGNGRTQKYQNDIGMFISLIYSFV